MRRFSAIRDRVKSFPRHKKSASEYYEKTPPSGGVLVGVRAKLASEGTNAREFLASDANANVAKTAPRLGRE